MLDDSQWEDLTSENERVADSAELSGLHRAAATAPAPRAGVAHPASSRAGAGVPAAHGTAMSETISRSNALHGDAETGSWTVRSLTARTRRWRVRSGAKPRI